MKSNTHIVTLQGEPVTRIIQEPDGRPNVHTGSREDAIEYTEAEAAEVVAWIGSGAEAELINETHTLERVSADAERHECRQ